MRVSRYATDIEIDDNIRMVYHTVSRKYYSYTAEYKKDLWDFIKNPNKKEYTIREAQLIKKLFDAGILINDDRDELADLEYLEQRAKFQDSSFRMTIYTTNACNFKCTYCMQEHEVRNLQETVIENIVAAIRVISKRVRKLEISWFGASCIL